MRTFAQPLLRRSRIKPRQVIIAVLAIGTLLLAQWVLSLVNTGTQSKHWETPFPVLLLGTITGMSYGLLSVGLVLTYRHNQIINFAHGDVGAFATSAMAVIVVNWGFPYWVALPVALLIGAATGAALEASVIRRLRSAPRLMSIIATLGAGSFISFFAFVINQTFVTTSYPRPPFLPNFSVGGLLVTNAHFALLLLAPIATLAIAYFLFRTRYGFAVRASADNPEAARLSGVLSGRMSSLVWGLAGALAAMTAILTQPTRGFTGVFSLGPGLLLRALTGAAIAGMSSLPLALIGGVVLGIIEQLLQWNYLSVSGGLVDITLFVIILVALLIRRNVSGREEQKGSWAAVQALRPLPRELRTLWTVRHLGTFVGLPALVLGLSLPFAISNASATIMTGIFAVTIVGLSLGVVTGLGGQLSLGQFAIAAIGGVVSLKVVSHGGNFWFGFLYAGLAAAAVSVLVGAPALKVRGPLLTVTTLAFAVATPTWLLAQPWMLGAGVNANSPAPFNHPLDSGQKYYFFAIGVLLIAFLLSRNIRRNGFGRLLIAVRDNEDNAKAFTIPATLIKFQGFLFAGFLAGIGGALYAHSLSVVDASAFPVTVSISIAVMLVVGGVGVIAGPLIGALLVIGLPAFVELDAAGLAANSLGLLLLILFLPAGLAQVIEPVRDRLVRFLGRRAGIDVEAAYAGESAKDQAISVQAQQRLLPASQDGHRMPKGTLLLEARGLSKSFGGVQAVAGVSLQVRAGETVGLIGPNGAGKTTTFELLGGFTQPDSGSVWFAGEDVTALGPEARGRRGLIRSFQDAALFPTLTVEETIMLALERVHRTNFLAASLGFGKADRRKRAEGAAIVSAMGLDRYRNKRIQELSTGTRRITEIACLVTMRPTLLLLDEPSSGIAQRETEALGVLLENLKDSLDVTLLIIEHDIPLIMSLSDRIVAMADGQIITSGTPDAVRNHPQVIESYLGGSLQAIERSGTTGAPARSGGA